MLWVKLLSRTNSSTVRDNWEAKKEEHEQALSEILGQPWTINIDPKAIWPYADDGSWAKTSTGDMLSR